jgi:hypothetical protein
MPTKTETDKLNDLQETDSQGRIGRTLVQVGIPTAIVGIGTYLCALAHIDLDPGPGKDMPADVVGYFIAITTGIGAVLMNRKPRR